MGCVAGTISGGSSLSDRNLDARLNPDQEKPAPIRIKLRLIRPDTQKNAGFSLDVDVEIPGAGVTAIFGHSGSGKTTFLRCIAGLEKASGKLDVNGSIWQSDKTFLPAYKRPIGYVFQEASLFAHLTASDNLQYAIKRSGLPKNNEHFESILQTLGIEKVLQRYPHELSGGERQRVAIARALLIQPQLLLMDEPLASLDMARKQEILPYLENLCATSSVPILYVSHSIDEVVKLADHVVVLDQGKVAASGSVTDVFSRINPTFQPESDLGVILDGTVVERDTRWHLCRIAFDGGDLWLRDTGDEINRPVRVRVLARDVSIALEHHHDTSILNKIPVKVCEIFTTDEGTITIVRLKAGESYIIARLTAKSAHYLNLTPGMPVWAQIKSVALVQ